MRCPKCGYISFDHLEACGKCNKDLSAVSASLDGGLYSTEAPRFLVIASEEDTTSEPFDLAEDAGDDVISLDGDYIDPDLEILVAGEGDTLEEDSDFEIEGPDLELPEVEEEFIFDDHQDVELGDLDDDGGGFSFDEPAEDESISLSLPDELSDISDLSPPAAEDDDFPILEGESAVEEPAPATEIDMDLGDLDLDLGSFDELMEPNDGSGGDFELSLDDIDFSSAVPEEVDTPVVDDGAIDMDSELDFELDLGGITLHKDK